MGDGGWDTDVYRSTVNYRTRTTGSAFASDAYVRSTPHDRLKVHESLDPMGLTIRESRDSVEHPRTCPIIVCLDVTGSNIRVARIVQAGLPALNGLILLNGYVDDPQILFCAIGDNTSDAISLQVGQFESDNRMEEQLSNIILYGGGGSGTHESYENMFYVAARHTASDAWDKRRQKGYFFILGDEMARSFMKKEDIARLLGEDVQEDVSFDDLVAEVKERYHVFYILPKLSSHGGEAQMLEFWQGYLGQNVVEVDDPESVPELIGSLIGMTEGSVDLDGVVENLRGIGSSDRTLTAVSAALANHPGALAVVGSASGLAGLDDSPSRARRI